MRVLLLFIAGLSAAGCFSSATLVRVQADGSGTIELTATVRKAALAKVDEMIPDVGNRKVHRVEDWFPEQAAKDAGANLGTNVRFVSSETVDTSDVLGRITTYAFTDIRQLTLDMIPVLPSGDGFASASGRFVGESRFTFDLFDGPDGRVLVARFPDAQIEHADPELPAAGPDDPQGEKLLRALVRGARLEVAVEPELPIARTNTAHRFGQRVTLLGIDAERLLLDKGAADRMLLRPATLDELRYKLHDTAGVTVSLDREVRIELVAQ